MEHQVSFMHLSVWARSLYQSTVHIGFGVVFCSILTIAFSISLLFFLIFHSKLVLSNYTTLEFGVGSSPRGDEVQFIST